MIKLSKENLRGQEVTKRIFWLCFSLILSGQIKAQCVLNASLLKSHIDNCFKVPQKQKDKSEKIEFIIFADSVVFLKLDTSLSKCLSGIYLPSSYKKKFWFAVYVKNNSNFSVQIATKGREKLIDPHTGEKLVLYFTFYRNAIEFKSVFKGTLN